MKPLKPQPLNAERLRRALQALRDIIWANDDPEIHALAFSGLGLQLASCVQCGKALLGCRSSRRTCSDLCRNRLARSKRGRRAGGTGTTVPPRYPERPLTP